MIIGLSFFEFLFGGSNTSLTEEVVFRFLVKPFKDVLDVAVVFRLSFKPVICTISIFKRISLLISQLEEFRKTFMDFLIQYKDFLAFNLERLYSM